MDDLWVLTVEEEIRRQNEQAAFVFWMGVLVVWGVSCIAAVIVGGRRGRPGAGFLCGAILGPLGVVAALFLPNGEEEKSKKPGTPVARQRRMPVKQDPFEAFEARERAQWAFEQGPEHLRGRNVEDES